VNRKQRMTRLDALRSEERTMVFHEAPHKLRTTLKDLCAAFGGERKIAMCREMTKLHEETLRMTLDEAVNYYQENAPKGEYVLVVAGAEPAEGGSITLEEGAEQVRHLREGGMRMKDAVRQVAEETGLPKNELYDAALEK
jgi:16S rRNA (cytidine1402-2'-O)-methyltransferase